MKFAPDDPELATVVDWLDEWWRRSEPRRRTWFFEDLRQRYPDFERWLRIQWGESGEVDS